MEDDAVQCRTIPNIYMYIYSVFCEEWENSWMKNFHILFDE
jgi:hypothetical protein